MRFGIFGGATAHNNGHVSDSQHYRAFIDYVVEAEKLGFYSTFLVEHHFTGLGQVSASLNLLTYLAAKTTRMRLGTAVVVLPWHNPVLLAEQAATLDLLSDGRFDFGIGRGYRPNEFDGFCMPMDEADERYQECVDILKKAMSSTERFSHHGKRWHYEDIIVEPPVVQRPHPPLWLGAFSDRSTREAAEKGFNLMLDQRADPDTVGSRVAAYREIIEGQGKTFDPLTVAVTRGYCLARTPEEREAAHRARPDFALGVNQIGSNKNRPNMNPGRPQTLEDSKKLTEVNALIGPPEEIIMRLKKLQSMGVEYVLMMDVTWSKEALRIFANEVMPEFTQKPAQAAE